MTQVWFGRRSRGFLACRLCLEDISAQADVPGLPGPGHGRHVRYAHAQHTAQPPISFQRLAFIK